MNERFDLTRTSLLGRFTPAKGVPAGPLFDRPGAVHRRYFQGSSELRYHVLAFQDASVREHWDSDVSKSTPGWRSPARNPERGGVRRGLLGGELIPGLMPRVAFVGMFVVVVYGFQHKGKGPGLSNGVLGKVMDGVFEELIRRAKSPGPSA
jgi:hypothetical protein